MQVDLNIWAAAAVRRDGKMSPRPLRYYTFLVSDSLNMESIPRFLVVHALASRKALVGPVRGINLSHSRLGSFGCYLSWKLISLDREKTRRDGREFHATTAD